MLNTEFTEWMYGFCCLSNETSLSARQLWIIKNHLNLVFAVEGFLDKRNQWLDDVILSLVEGDVITSPSISLIHEIFAKYARIDGA